MFFPQLVKRCVYFFPSSLKIYKIANKKRLTIFRLRRSSPPPFTINFSWGKNIGQKGGGQKYEFKI